MTSGRRCPCCEEPFEPYGCGCGLSPFGGALRRSTLRSDGDLVIGLNDVRTAEDNELADVVDAPPRP